MKSRKMDHRKTYLHTYAARVSIIVAPSKYSHVIGVSPWFPCFLRAFINDSRARILILKMCERAPGVPYRVSRSSPLLQRYTPRVRVCRKCRTCNHIWSQLPRCFSFTRVNCRIVLWMLIIFTMGSHLSSIFQPRFIEGSSRRLDGGYRIPR